MGLSDKKQETKGTTSTTASYDWKTPPSTPSLDTLRHETFHVDPGLDAEYGNLRSQVDKSFHDPMGASYNPQVVAQQRRAAMERLGTQEASAYRAGQYDVNKLDYARDMAVAGHETPVLTQTGSTGSQQGTTIQSESPWKTATQLGTAVAPVSL